MAESTELLHLLKAGRILQYRQQNIALMSAAEGVEFEIFYAERWLAPDLEVSVGDGCVVVLADTPYDRSAPIRYATVTASDQSRAGLQLTVKVGPHVVVEDESLLEPPRRTHPAGTPFFAWRAVVTGMRPPQSDHEARLAWRSAVGRLAGNDFYSGSSFARIVRVSDHHGHEVRERRLELGQTATAVLEVHSPGQEGVYSLIVDADPSGSVAGGIDSERPDAEHHLHVPIRPLTVGSQNIELSFLPDPLLSSRLSFALTTVRPTVSDPTPSPSGSSAKTSAAEPVLVQGLAEHLRRQLNELDPDDWLTLLLEHILPLAPDDPVVRSITAEAAHDLQEWRTVVELLDDPARFRSGDAFHRLIAGLHDGSQTDVASLLGQIDLGVEKNVVELEGELQKLPDGAVRQIVEVLLNAFAGKEILDRLLPRAFERVRDDLALRIAEECVAADPDAWVDRVIRRWPDPHLMPHDALAMLLGWEIINNGIAPYLKEAIEDAIDADDLETVLELASRGQTLLARAEQTRVQIAAARLVPDAEIAQQLLLAAADDVVGLGDPDLATELAFTMRELWEDGENAGIDESVERLETVLHSLPRFRDYLEWRDGDAADRVKPHVRGKVLHIVGAKRKPWADDLCERLALKDLRWHESEKRQRMELDWADAVDNDRDIVVLIWTHCGHATTKSLQSKGVEYRNAEWSRTSVLDSLREG